MGHQKEQVLLVVPAFFANFTSQTPPIYACENWHNLRYRIFDVILNETAGLSSASPMDSISLRV